MTDLFGNCVCMARNNYIYLWGLCFKDALARIYVQDGKTITSFTSSAYIRPEPVVFFFKDAPVMCGFLVSLTHTNLRGF